MFGDRGRPLVLIMGIGAQRIFWDDDVLRARRRRRLPGHALRSPRHRPVDAPRRAGPAADAARCSRAWRGSTSTRPTRSPTWRATRRPDRRARPRSRRTWSAPRSAAWSRSTSRSSTARASVDHRDHDLARRPPLHAEAARAAARCSRPRRRPPKRPASTSRSCSRRSAARAWPVDGERLRVLGEPTRSRAASNPRGFLRQFAAVMASGDRREAPAGGRRRRRS